MIIRAFNFMFTPWMWLAVMTVCILIESATMSLTTIWFACAALAMALLSLLRIPFRYELLLFLLLSLSLLLFTRPFVKKYIRTKKHAFNADAVIGKAAIVTEDIQPLNRGAVKVAGGLTWTARGEGGSLLKTGTECVVVAIEGATAVVRAQEQRTDDKQSSENA